MTTTSTNTCSMTAAEAASGISSLRATDVTGIQVLDRQPRFLWTTFRPDKTLAQDVAAYCLVAGTRNTHNSNHHTCILAVRGDPTRKPVWAWYCGDTVITGAKSKPDYAHSVAAALKAWDPHCDPTVPLPAPARRLEAMLLSSHGAEPANTGCHFWQIKNDGKVCKHLATFFNAVQAWSPQGKPGLLLQSMEREWASIDAIPGRRKR